MIRFFANEKNISQNTIKLTVEDSEHIRSLRLRPDELFVVCDGNGVDYLCCLCDGKSAGKKDKPYNGSSIAEIVKKELSAGEPSIKCTVYIAYQKGERLDYAVQKSIELGAHAIVLYDCKRCIDIPKNIPKKIERLQRIALETAKQCGRGIIPAVSSVSGFEAALDSAILHSDLVFLCYESEENLHIKTVLEEHFPAIQHDTQSNEDSSSTSLYQEENSRSQRENKAKSVAFVTGPEGGLEPTEVSLAQSKKIPVISLGSRILRCETAPAVVLAALMYHTDNL